MILFTLVTNLSDDIRKTVTATSAMIARSSSGVSTKQITLTSLTVLLQSVTIVVCFANLAVETVGVVQTLHTFSGLGITVPRSVQVGVVATFTRLTLSTGCFRVTVVIFRTAVAACTCVSLETLAHHILGYWIQGTAVSVRMSTVWRSYKILLKVVS